MEHLAHGDLQKYLTNPLPEREVRQIIAQLAEGLEYMHQNDFAHRDMKPLVGFYNFNVLFNPCLSYVHADSCW